MTPSKSPPNAGLDRVAVALSGLCLLHCLAIPFAILLGPLLGQWLIDSETGVHWFLLALALPVSVLALWLGYGRHRSRLTVALGGIGLVLMFVGVSHIFSENLEVALTVSGVTSLLFAHVRNMVGTHHHS